MEMKDKTVIVPRARRTMASQADSVLPNNFRYVYRLTMESNNPDFMVGNNKSSLERELRRGHVKGYPAQSWLDQQKRGDIRGTTDYNFVGPFLAHIITDKEYQVLPDNMKGFYERKDRVELYYQEAVKKGEYWMAVDRLHSVITEGFYFKVNILTAQKLGYEIEEQPSSSLDTNEPKSDSEFDVRMTHTGSGTKGSVNNTKSRKGVVWRLPSYTPSLTEAELRILRRSNKYLSHMQSRIQRSIARKDYYQATKVAMILIQRSRVFTVYVLTKTSKGYFWDMSEMSLWSNIRKYIEFVRNMQTTVHVTRFYLDKGMEKAGVPNGKLRPIGSPNLWSKMGFKAIEIVVREFLEPIIGEYQHGFIRNKGCQTATMDLITKLRANKKLIPHEFDLSSFFNRVNVIRTCDALNYFCYPIGDWIRAVTLGNIPVIKKAEIKPEKELIVRKIAADLRPPEFLMPDYMMASEAWMPPEWAPADAEWNRQQRPIVHRFGFTQGSPLSPLLCVFALEVGGIRNLGDLVMFADDGIVLSEQPVDIRQALGRNPYKLSGVTLAEDKPFGPSKRFKFLGLHYDMESRTVSYEVNKNQWIRLSIDDAPIGQLEQLAKYTKYKDTKPTPNREVNPSSMVAKVKDWVSYYATIAQIKYGGDIWSKVGRSIRNVLSNIRQHGEGWSQAGMSTVAGIAMLKRIELTKFDRRKWEVYMIPSSERRFQNTLKTSKGLAYRYESIDSSELDSYYTDLKIGRMNQPWDPTWGSEADGIGGIGDTRGRDPWRMTINPDGTRTVVIVDRYPVWTPSV